MTDYDEIVKEDKMFDIQDAFKAAKKQARKAAKDLRYPPEVIKQINKTENLDQLSIVMTSARHKYL